MSKNQPKGDVATRDPTSVVGVDKPDFLKEMEKAGPISKQDNFDSTDVAIPRIKLLQGLSEECTSFDSAKQGMFWHTGVDMSLGDNFSFIVISRKKKYLLVAPLQDGQGILARADDCVNWVPQVGTFTVKVGGKQVQWTLKPTVVESGLDKWGSSVPDDSNSPPAATLFYEYLVLLPDHLDLGPAVMMLQRTQIKKARKGLNDKIAMHEGAGRPMQALVFQAKAIKDENNIGTFYNYQFGSAGFVQSKELYDQVLELKNALATYQVRDEAKASGDDAGGATDSDAF